MNQREDYALHIQRLFEELGKSKESEAYDIDYESISKDIDQIAMSILKGTENTAPF
jgi:hypothetical protein